MTTLKRPGTCENLLSNMMVMNDESRLYVGGRRRRKTRQAETCRV